MSSAHSRLRTDERSIGEQLVERMEEEQDLSTDPAHRLKRGRRMPWRERF